MKEKTWPGIARRSNGSTHSNYGTASTAGTSSSTPHHQLAKPKRQSWQRIILLMPLVFLVEYYWMRPLFWPSDRDDNYTPTKRDTDSNGHEIATLASPSRQKQQQQQPSPHRRAIIFLARTDKPSKNLEYAYSLFLMNASTWKRFGSHRLELEVQWIDLLPNVTKTKKTKKKPVWGHPFNLSSIDTSQPSAPCLLVGKFTNELLAMQNETRVLKDCKRMISYDEYCRQAPRQVVHVRHYYSSHMPAHALYLPLGPRVDFVQALSSSSSVTKQWPAFDQRTYWINALFSASTSPVRRVLKSILDQDLDESIRKDSKIQIAPKWTFVPSADHLTPADYVAILSQSKFTLVPVGHNPESFRLWEALDRGSIPIVARQATDGQGNVWTEYNNSKPLLCSNSLQPMLEWKAEKKGEYQHPCLVVLKDWKDLPSFLQGVTASGDWNQRQQVCSSWYTSFMEHHLQRVEDLLLAG